MTRAFLLAGGRGTRLLPYTTVLPKPLVPVGERPVMELLLRQLVRDGVTDVIISVGYLAELLEAYFGDGRRFGVTIRYQREEEPLGTAGPLRLLDDWGPDESLLVLNGDLLTDIDFADFIAHHRGTGSAMQVGAYRRTEQVELGVLDVDPSGAVRGYCEKPLQTYDVSMGLYMIHARLRDLVPPGSRYDMPQLVLVALARGEPIAAYRHEGLWLDIGRPDDHKRAVELVAEAPERFLQPYRPART